MRELEGVSGSYRIKGRLDVITKYFVNSCQIGQSPIVEIDFYLLCFQPVTPGRMVIPIDISEKMHTGNHQEGHTEDFFVTCVTNLLDCQLRWINRFFDGGKENVGSDLFMQFGLEGGKGSATGVIGSVPQD